MIAKKRIYTLLFIEFICGIKIILNSLLFMTMNAPDKGFNRNNTCRYIPCYDNEVSFLYLTLSPSLMAMRCHSYTWHTASLITMKCHSYTWHSAQSYNNEMSFLYLTLSPSLITMRCHSYTWHSASLITMRCHSYTWHTVQSYNNEVSFLYLTLSSVL